MRSYTSSRCTSMCFGASIPKRTLLPLAARIVMVTSSPTLSDSRVRLVRISMSAPKNIQRACGGFRQARTDPQTEGMPVSRFGRQTRTGASVRHPRGSGFLVVQHRKTNESEVSLPRTEDKRDVAQATPARTVMRLHPHKSTPPLRQWRVFEAVAVALQQPAAWAAGLRTNSHDPTQFGDSSWAD